MQIAMTPTQTPSETTSEPSDGDASGNGKSFVSPVVARIASEHGVDPSQVPGTGQGGHRGLGQLGRQGLGRGEIENIELVDPRRHDQQRADRKSVV